MFTGSQPRLRWARWIGVWTAAAVVCGSLVLAPVASAGWALPRRPAGIRLYTGLQGKIVPTRAQLVAIAHRSSVVVATPAGVRAYQATLKAANPSIDILVYENGGYSTPTDPRGMPESWFLHAASGQRVRSAANPSNELMYPRSLRLFHSSGRTYRGWGGYVARECLRDQTRNTGGCLLDALGPTALNPAGDVNGVVPVDPLTHHRFTDRSYMAMTSAFAGRVQRRTLLHIVANGLRSGNGYFRKSTYLIDSIGSVGGEAEVWMGAGTWKQNVAMLIRNAHGGSGALINYEATGSRPLETQREFATASFLIGRGAHEFFQFSDAQHTSFQLPSPLYAMRIGRPFRSRPHLRDYLHGGVYRRVYTNGKAVVNPGSSTITVKLGGRFKDVNGNVMTSVTLGPRTGIVLVRAR